jgi:hypothetical protein
VCAGQKFKLIHIHQTHLSNLGTLGTFGTLGLFLGLLQSVRVVACCGRLRGLGQRAVWYNEAQQAEEGAGGVGDARRHGRAAVGRKAAGVRGISGVSR